MLARFLTLLIPPLLGVLCSVCASVVWAEARAKVANVPVVAPKPAQPVVVRRQRTESLPDDVTAYMRKRKIPPKELSVFIQDVHADAPLLQHNADTAHNPASTMKLLTTWGALKVLGPAWTWKTEVLLRGELDNGVLNGDVVLKGYGDPFLVYESFWKLLHDLRLKGLRDIRGDVIVDNSFFDIPVIDPGAFDNKPDRIYNAPPSALMFNFQATRFLFQPDKDKDQVLLSAFPFPSSVSLQNQMTLSEGKCRRRHYRPNVKREGTAAVMKGQYATGCGAQFIMRRVSDAEVHVYDAFREFWKAQGGMLRGKGRVGKVQTGDQLFHTHASKPLAEQIRSINKWSNNVMTRQVLLTMGAKRFGAPATLDKGRMALLEVMEHHQIPTQGMVVDNGSGLSRDARLSANQLGKLLYAIWHEPLMPEFMNSLPLIGEDGTLARRLKDHDVRGRSHLKTGTLNQVTALAGYMLNRDGKRLVVVMQQNGKKANGAGKVIQDKVLKWAFEQ